jgi:hypothetical protein
MSLVGLNNIKILIDKIHKFLNPSSDKIIQILTQFTHYQEETFEKELVDKKKFPIFALLF